MPTSIWHHLENQFDNVSKESRKRMNAILADTHAKLTSRAGGLAVELAGDREFV